LPGVLLFFYEYLILSKS